MLSNIDRFYNPNPQALQLIFHNQFVGTRKNNRLLRGKQLLRRINPIVIKSINIYILWLCRRNMYFL